MPRTPGVAAATIETEADVAHVGTVNISVTASTVMTTRTVTIFSFRHSCRLTLDGPPIEISLNTDVK